MVPWRQNDAPIMSDRGVRLAVVVPTRNRRELARRAVATTLAQIARTAGIRQSCMAHIIQRNGQFAISIAEVAIA
jgi:hypothetical protein